MKSGLMLLLLIFGYLVAFAFGQDISIPQSWRVRLFQLIPPVDFADFVIGLNSSRSQK